MKNVAVKIHYTYSAYLLPLFFVAFLFATPALARPIDDCRSSDPKISFGGCSEAIRQGGPANADLIVAYSRRSDVHLALGAYSDAIADRARALKLDPGSKHLSTRLVEAYAASGQQNIDGGSIDGAIVDFDAAVKVEPDNTALGDMAVFLHKQRGKSLLSKRYAVSIQDFDFVLTRHPRDVETLLLRALAHEQFSYFPNAVADYEAVLAIDPDNSDARTGRTRAEPPAIALVKLIQIQLTRLGCDVGQIDGKWGRKSEAALSVLAAPESGAAGHAKDKPDETLLGVLRGVDFQICKKPGQPVQKTNGGQSCFTFNTQTFCE
tara:strand:- start:2458 stop:3420 length:963 start_codon:yes stop_codon:yes gene_type:complete